MKTGILFLTIWLNHVGGGQEFILEPLPMPETQCIEIQNAIWDSEPETIGADDLGPIPLVDAACLPAAEALK